MYGHMGSARDLLAHRRWVDTTSAGGDPYPHFHTWCSTAVRVWRFKKKKKKNAQFSLAKLSL